jgi:hypothetical protein
MASELTVGGITASGNISTTAGILSISGPTASGTVATIFGSTGFGFSFIADAVAGPFDNIISTGTGEVISLGVAGVPYATVSPTGLAVTGAVTVSGGIQFPATQSASADANNLDDYEEGVWYPGISFGGGAVGITYSAQSGTYVKVGSLVTVGAYIQMTAKGSSTGTARITGLPFTVLAGSVGYTLSFHYAGDVSTFTGATSDASPASTTATIRLLGATTTALATEANLNNGTAFFLSGSYRA